MGQREVRHIHVWPDYPDAEEHLEGDHNGHFDKERLLLEFRSLGKLATLGNSPHQIRLILEVVVHLGLIDFVNEG